MGLANQFGDQAYKCENCGQTTALYAPHCPVCLNKTLTRVKPQKWTGTNQSANEEARETRQPVSPLISFATVAAIVAACVAAYAMFAPRQEPITKPEPSPQSTAQSESSSSSTHVSPPKHIKHPNTHSVISKAHAVSTGSLPAPKRVVPMRLWESTSGDEGGSP
jgi:hypothetical protein